MIIKKVRKKKQKNTIPWHIVEQSQFTKYAAIIVCMNMIVINDNFICATIIEMK